MEFRFYTLFVCFYNSPSLEFCVTDLGVPSSVDLVCSDPAHLVTSFTNGQIGLFNMETRQLVLTLESPSEPGKHGL